MTHKRTTAACFLPRGPKRLGGEGETANDLISIGRIKKPSNLAKQLNNSAKGGIEFRTVQPTKSCASGQKRTFSPPAAKIRGFQKAEFFSFLFSESMLIYRRPVSHEGRFAVVTNVEAGCGGRVVVAAWFSAPTNDGDAHGQVAWS
ncbi:hypothetical protein HL666_09920 [Bradyrhizobium sp. 83002]|uniref:hypothetical protein n=1 Tax=Bradyrhizobium aeschynomenes TaxID=2734909 RepID=UPI001554B563|nr:hypothetical protein [Bradyrhizobium aeschynomenes]NPU11079.1 hypothetical protein [Bradyrhizobium aeschynomenes]